MRSVLAKTECLSRFGERFPTFTGGGFHDDATGRPDSG
jgi:hypothetical protein